MNINLAAITDSELEQTLIAANDAYRNTEKPVMSDEEYDQHIAELIRRNPKHRLLATVEPEDDFGWGKVRHKTPMLSTAKCYTESELVSWVRKVEAVATDLGMRLPVPIKINAKLDGMAGRMDGGVLASRGDGLTGNDITHMMSKGLVMVGDGDGELVMDKVYFEENLSGEFKHPRNVVTGAVSADVLRPAAKQALEDQAIRFISYSSLKHVYTDTAAVVEALPVIREQILGDCEYPTDGLILVVESPELRAELGSTGHHHNWMLAAKTVTDTAETLVTGISWNVGRTGRLCPVIQIVPVELSGALISNVTGHNAGTIEERQIGVGSIVEVTRSGEVIPFLMSVKRPCLDVELPTTCSACECELDRQGDFLMCRNDACKGRLRARFIHFFNILGTIDLFGPVACERLVNAGVKSVREVFALTPEDFERMGFGAGQAANLRAELDAGLVRPIDDFRVLAAIGIEHLGRGDSKRLLKHFGLKDVVALTAPDISGISGFGDLTARAIVEAIPSIYQDLVFLADNMKGVVATPSLSAAATDSPISGKHIVFTGTMTQGSRSDMVSNAEKLGAIAQSAVNKKTDYLVAGEKVGKSKLTKAESLGTIIMSESDYLALTG